MEPDEKCYKILKELIQHTTPIRTILTTYGLTSLSILFPLISFWKKKQCQGLSAGSSARHGLNPVISHPHPQYHHKWVIQKNYRRMLRWLPQALPRFQIFCRTGSSWSIAPPPKYARLTSGVIELQPSRTTPQCTILIWKSETCLIWILAIWGSWVYPWSFWPYLEIKYCLIWKLNIALFENWILPYLNHDVFLDLLDAHMPNTLQNIAYYIQISINKYSWKPGKEFGFPNIVF